MDKEKGSWRESVDGALAKTSSPPAETSSPLSRLLPGKVKEARLQLNPSAPVKKPTGDPTGVKANDAPAWPSTASARPELRLERAAGVSRQNRED
jgi:hypothetical protein